jgi:predicted esterase
MLGLDTPRDGLLYLPRRYRADSPAPLAMLLHGAGGNARLGGSVLQFVANRTGIIFLAPESCGRTWDVIRGGYGPDVAYIDRALAHIFSRYAIDPARLAIGGFSDGASYALSLGIANGDLFTHIIAFSPGFIAPAPPHGQPRIFITHGTRDRVLPIDRCSRRIVPRLRGAGYDVRYREFNGPHIIPPHIAVEAVRWLAAYPAGSQHPRAK